MTFLTLIQLIATIAGGIEDVADIIQKIHSLNLKPGEAVPQEHVDAVKAVISKINSAAVFGNANYDPNQDNYRGE